MTRVVWRFSFCFLLIVYISEKKVLIGLKRVSSIKEIPTSKYQSFLNLFFRPKSNMLPIFLSGKYKNDKSIV